MSDSLPQIEHVYINHSIDSTRWEPFTARDGDIVVASSIKSGTTWMQSIVLHLISAGLKTPLGLLDSPWIDSRIRPLDEVITQLENQQHRRCIKTHLPLDGLRYFPEVRYIVVTRDARDVFMSLWNHYRNLTPGMLKQLNDLPVDDGRPFPKCPDDIRKFWQSWITTGWFEWESEGYPYWSNLRHTQTWWNYRHLPNLLFVHFNDLLSNTLAEIQRIVDHIQINLSQEQLISIAEAVQFANIKKKAEQLLPNMTAIKGGAQTFFNKGTNGRWRGILTESDLELYQSAVQRELSSDCLYWLEHGRTTK